MCGTDVQMSDRCGDDTSKHFIADGSAKGQGPGSDQPISS